MTYHNSPTVSLRPSGGAQWPWLAIGFAAVVWLAVGILALLIAAERAQQAKQPPPLAGPYQPVISSGLRAVPDTVWAAMAARRLPCGHPVKSCAFSRDAVVYLCQLDHVSYANATTNGMLTRVEFWPAGYPMLH